MWLLEAKWKVYELIPLLDVEVLNISGVYNHFNNW